MLKRQSNRRHLRGQVAVLRQGGKIWRVTLLGNCRKGWQICWESWRVRYSPTTSPFSPAHVCNFISAQVLKEFLHSQSCRTNLSTLSKSSQMLLRPPRLRQRPPLLGPALPRLLEHQVHQAQAQRHPYQILPILLTAP